MAYVWHDGGWMSYRGRAVSCAMRANVYGICPCSWRKGVDGSCLDLCELSRELIPYVKQMGYTHVSLDKRFLEGNEGSAFVDGLHCAGVGVIVSGFSDENGADALSWIKEQHVDGLVLPDGEGKLEQIIKKELPELLLLKKSRIWTDTVLSFMKKDPIYRKYHHDELIDAIEQSLGTSSLIAVDGDDVTNGKGSLLNGMYGDYAEKFAGERLLLAHMMTLPAKKLLFMGAEIGQFGEWDPFGQIDWFLLGFEKHAQLQKYVSDLNMLCLEESALWGDGLEWLDCSEEMSVISYMRTDKEGNELCVILNFTPVFRRGYVISTGGASYVEAFCSDGEQYGGGGSRNQGILVPCDHGGKLGISVNIPPLSAIILKKIKL